MTFNQQFSKPATYDGVAPPGWEEQVKELKKKEKVDNPWALAWYLKNKRDNVRATGALAPIPEDGLHENLTDHLVALHEEIKSTGEPIPEICVRAGNGDPVAMTNLMADSVGGAHIYQENPW